MKKKPEIKDRISRRSIFPFLGSTLLIPFLGFSRSKESESIDDPEDEFQTLLKPDGTIVKVKTSAIKNSKVVKQKVSNKGLLNWLGKKL